MTVERTRTPRSSIAPYEELTAARRDSPVWHRVFVDRSALREAVWSPRHRG
jgi:hypothetical protein